MSDTNKPTHKAFVVKEFKGKDGTTQSRWIEIGSLWPHKDGEGFDLNLDAHPIGDRVSIRAFKPKPDADTAKG
jgi:hypothetical protein